MFKICRNNKGMTLVELVCALILIMIVITGFAWMFTMAYISAHRSQDQHRNYTEAKKLSDNVMASPQKVLDAALDNTDPLHALLNDRNIEKSTANITVKLTLSNTDDVVVKPHSMIYVEIEEDSVYTSVDSSNKSYTMPGARDTVFRVPVNNDKFDSP